MTNKSKFFVQNQQLILNMSYRNTQNSLLEKHHGYRYSYLVSYHCAEKLRWVLWAQLVELEYNLELLGCKKSKTLFETEMINTFRIVIAHSLFLQFTRERFF